MKGGGGHAYKIHKASFIANPNPIKIPLVKDNTDSPRITKYSLFSNYHITLIKYFFCFRQYRGIDFRVNTSDLTLRIRSSNWECLNKQSYIGSTHRTIGWRRISEHILSSNANVYFIFFLGGGQHVYWEPKPSHVP